MIEIAKWEGEQMEAEILINMHPMKRKIGGKENEQQQRKVWALGKFQEETLEQQKLDRANGQQQR